MVIVETQEKLDKRKIMLASESYEQKKKRALPWILLNGLKVLVIYTWMFSSSTVFKNWRGSIGKSAFKKEITCLCISIKRWETTDCVQIFLVGVEAGGCTLEEGRVGQKDSNHEGGSHGSAVAPLWTCRLCRPPPASTRGQTPAS